MDTLGAPSPLSAPVEIPFVLEGGHMMIDASINGGPKQTYLFDTGGRILLTPDAARGLKSTHVRDGMVGGIGPNLTKASVVRVDQIAVGGTTLYQQTVTIAELPNWVVDRGAKPRLAGLIGPELITRRTVTIDYRKQVMTLHPPGHVRPGPNAAVARLGFSVSPEGLGHPSISAVVGGVEGELVIDTGASGAIYLSNAFITSHHPFRPGGKIIRFLSPGGVGGELAMQVGVGTTFTLGATTFSSLLMAGPATPEKRSMAPAVGLVGAEILARFVVTLDFPNNRAWFEPIAGTAPLARWNSVGLILNKPAPAHFEVVDVLPGTAAERAGIRRGEKIVSYGGQPARSLGLRDLSRFRDKSVSVVMEDQRRHELSPVQVLP